MASGILLARTNSTIRRRNSGGYGGRDFGMTDTSSSKNYSVHESGATPSPAPVMRLLADTCGNVYTRIQTVRPRNTTADRRKVPSWIGSEKRNFLTDPIYLYFFKGVGECRIYSKDMVHKLSSDFCFTLCKYTYDHYFNAPEHQEI